MSARKLHQRLGTIDTPFEECLVNIGHDYTYIFIYQKNIMSPVYGVYSFGFANVKNFHHKRKNAVEIVKELMAYVL